MRKLFVAVIMAIASLTLGAQVITQPPSAKLTDKELGLQYLKKSRTLKIAGWSMLGAGLIISTIGFNQATNDLFSDSNSGEALSLVGTILTIGSIPCFIGGAKNKGRAEILLRNENIMISNKSQLVNPYPSLALAINF